MAKYSIQNVRDHWASNAAEFSRSYPVCEGVFREIGDFGSAVVGALAHRKELEANCAFLLFSKSLNHAFSVLLLLERGLVVDAALSTRNAVESLLLLELLVKVPSLCSKWAGGEEFKPAFVRGQLAALSSVPVRDVIVEVSPDTYEDVRKAYSWLSRITHANVESLNHTATNQSPNDYVIYIGGAHSRPAAIAITAVLGSAFLRAGTTSVAVYAIDEFETHRPVFDRLTRQTALLRANGA